MAHRAPDGGGCLLAPVGALMAGTAAVVVILSCSGGGADRPQVPREVPRPSYVEGFPVAPDERCAGQGDVGRMSTGVWLDCVRDPRTGDLRWRRR